MKYEITLNDTMKIDDHSKNHLNSEEKVGGKPKKEIIQYIENKEKGIMSEIEKLRENDKKTQVKHKLYKKSEGEMKVVHEHLK